MVGMVVGNKYMVHGGETEAIVAAVFLQPPQTYAYVDEQCIVSGR